MPHLTTDDGVKLYYEETGKGIPIVFIHEFAGDCRSWEQQVRYFARYYRCAASEPRSARLEGIRRSARRAFDRRRGADNARRSEAPPVALRIGRQDEDDH